MKKLLCYFVFITSVLPLYSLDPNAIMEEAGRELALIITAVIGGVEPGETRGVMADGTPYTLKFSTAPGRVSIAEFTKDVVGFGTTREDAELHSMLLLVAAAAYLENYGFSRVNSAAGFSFIFRGAGGSVTVTLEHTLNNARSGDGRFRFRAFYKARFQP